jgi:hypothetical protein
MIGVCPKRLNRILGTQTKIGRQKHPKNRKPVSGRNQEHPRLTAGSTRDRGLHLAYPRTSRVAPAEIDHVGHVQSLDQGVQSGLRSRDRPLRIVRAGYISATHRAPPLLGKSQIILCSHLDLEASIIVQETEVGHGSALSTHSRRTATADNIHNTCVVEMVVPLAVGTITLNRLLQDLRKLS